MQPTSLSLLRAEGLGDGEREEKDRVRVFGRKAQRGAEIGLENAVDATSLVAPSPTHALSHILEPAAGCYTRGIKVYGSLPQEQVISRTVQVPTHFMY